MFLHETKLHFSFLLDKILVCKFKLFNTKVSVENFRCSFGGCIPLKWNSSIFSFDPLLFTDQFIHGLVKVGSSKAFFLTTVYAHNDPSDRIHLWNMLKDLNGPTDTPWLVMGDFNVVLYTNEKAGGKPYC